MKAFLLILLFFMCSSSASSNDNNLKSCPDKPNCVSSQAQDEHAIEPFMLADNSTFDLQKVVALIQYSDKRVSVIHDDHKIHAEFTSQVFGFVDDVDLVINQEQSIIHVRSASRTGHYDFGVNRRRVEDIRSLLKEEGVIQ